jgi:hypothetical protein
MVALNYFVDFESAGFPVAVTVDDARIYNSVAGRGSRGARLVNMWVRPGANQARLTPMPEADAAAGERLGGSAILTVATQEGDDKMTRVELARLVWPPVDGSPAPRLEDTPLAFQAEPAPPSELWAAAEPVMPDAASRDAIIDLAGRLHAALASRDLSRVMDLVRFSISDVGRSVYIEPEVALENQRSILADVMEGAWHPERWDATQAQVHLSHDGLLAEVTLDDRPAIRVALDDARYVLPVCIGRLGGRLVIAR